MTTTRQKVEAELRMARSEVETKRLRGESDAHEQAQVRRLQGELDRLREINEAAAPVVRAME